MCRNSPHDQHVSGRKRIGKEIAGCETNTMRQVVTLDIGVEGSADDRQIKPRAGEMRMGQRDLHGNAAFSRAYVEESRIPAPWKFCGERTCRRQAGARHSFDEEGQPLRIGVELREMPRRIEPGLRPAGPKRLGESAPLRVFARIQIVDEATNIFRLPGIEIAICDGSPGV